MKRKNLPLIIASIFAAILVAIAGFLLIGRRANFTIPDGYAHKFTHHLSHVDGPDLDYYVYPGKIIVETNSYYPSGRPSNVTHERKITLYDHLTTEEINSLDDVYAAIEDKTGKVVLHTKE